MGFIYLITCSVTKKQYVGQTLDDVKDRWREHKYGGNVIVRARSKDPTLNIDGTFYKQIRNNLLYNAMADHGIESFSIKTIEEVPEDELNDAEINNIVKYNTLYPYGYNATTGGNSKYRHRPESIALMKKVKHERVDSIRHATLVGLPPYTTYGVNPKSGDDFYVKQYGSIDDTKKAVIEFLDDLVRNDTTYQRFKVGGNRIPIGMKETKKGFKIEIHRGGKIYRDGFESKNHTREENYEKAMIRYREIM